MRQSILAGSGIHADFDDGSVTEEALQERLRPLSHFQRFILSAALRFPSAQKVVYSTCSIHKEEDEDVVFSLLEEEEFKHTWELDSPHNVLPNWPMRGKPEGHEKRSSAEIGSLIRCERRLGTHGFFVAVFVRKQGGQNGTTSKMRSWGPKSTAEAAKSTEPYMSDTSQSQMEPDSPYVSKNVSLLRLATLDRRRRQKLVALHAVEKLRKKGRRQSRKERI